MKNDFILLITGTADNEYTAENLAAPGTDLVRCRISYVQPFEDFGEIKKLQTRLSRSEYIKGRAVSCLLDLSEWIGHEKEEYFILLLKYLHDHRSLMFLIFTVGEHTEEQAGELYFRLRCFLRGSIATDMIFINTSALCGYIEGKRFSHDAANLLAELIMSDAMSELRSYPVTDMICADIRGDSSAEDIIGVGAVTGYLRDPDALPYILDSVVTEKFVSAYENRVSEALSA